MPVPAYCRRDQRESSFCAIAGRFLFLSLIVYAYPSRLPVCFAYLLFSSPEYHFFPIALPKLVVVGQDREEAKFLTRRDETRRNTTALEAISAPWEIDLGAKPLLPSLPARYHNRLFDETLLYRLALSRHFFFPFSFKSSPRLAAANCHLYFSPCASVAAIRVTVARLAPASSTVSFGKMRRSWPRRSSCSCWVGYL